VTVNAAAVAAVGVVAFLVVDGFLVNQLGELSWHGAADDQRLFVFIVVSVSGLLAGGAYRAVRHWAVWDRRAGWLAAQSPVAGPQPRATVTWTADPETVPDVGAIWPRKATPVATGFLVKEREIRHG
jgi:hypothetical protein